MPFTPREIFLKEKRQNKDLENSNFENFIDEEIFTPWEDSQKSRYFEYWSNKKWDSKKSIPEEIQKEEQIDK